MMPVLFKIPGIGYEVPGYGLALMVGFLLSIMWAAHRALKSGANPDVILNCGFVALIGGIVGSRAMYVIHYWEQYADRGSALAVFFAVIDVRKGGLEVYGGVIAVVVVVLFYLWRGKHSIRWYLDIAAPSTALGMAIGRIGCFVNGCCWGGVCDLPWAVQFPFGSPTAVQQWQDCEPGAELPAELLIFGDMPNGDKAIPVSREALRLSDAELNAARAVFDDIVKQTRDLKDKLDRATDSAEEQRIEQELRVVARQALPNTSPHAEIVGPVMSKYGLSAAELRKLAHQHPALPVHPTQLYSLAHSGAAGADAERAILAAYA